MRKARARAVKSNLTLDWSSFEVCRSEFEKANRRNTRRKYLKKTEEIE